MFLILFIYFSISSYGSTNVYAASSPCEYYQELTSDLGCHKDNYLIKFAYYYCKRFEKKEYKFSAHGQRFLQNTRVCLIKKMDDAIHDFWLNDIVSSENTCNKIAAIGYASHIPCYLENRFCALSRSDRRRITLTLGREILNRNVYRVRRAIYRQCGLQL
ncbi:MAG: hypothetical protein A2Z20_03320 [Bdellovibrionales bacterium RBG_16_40_8]|nr:MAG: hypothetical protein A2Z20_03320 [Bdellovibrionales bacterium RBG_16_40_8]